MSYLPKSLPRITCIGTEILTRDLRNENHECPQLVVLCYIPSRSLMRYQTFRLLMPAFATELWRQV
jgi:hypothetical protein